jgi:prepilin-type N-terminal cleavage/methylation domain-containing protein
MFQNEKGYTLIELIVVIVLIGLLMSFTIPRFQDSLLTDDLKGATRNMVELINSLREDAVGNQKSYFLWFDLGTNRYWVSFSGMTEEENLSAREESAHSLQEVEIREIRFSTEKSVTSGEVSIHFDKRGYVQPSEIHLGSDDGRECALVLSPFLRKVEINVTRE